MALTALTDSLAMEADIGLALGPFAVPVDASLVGLSFDRSLWDDPALRVSVTIELSLDGGATWNDRGSEPFPIGAEFAGGPLLDRQNNPLLSAVLGNTQVPGVGNDQRMLRCLLTGTGPFTTSCSLVSS